MAEVRRPPAADARRRQVRGQLLHHVPQEARGPAYDRHLHEPVVQGAPVADKVVDYVLKKLNGRARRLNLRRPVLRSCGRVSRTV